MGVKRTKGKRVFADTVDHFLHPNNGGKRRATVFACEFGSTTIIVVKGGVMLFAEVGVTFYKGWRFPGGLTT